MVSQEYYEEWYKDKEKKLKTKFIEEKFTKANLTESIFEVCEEEFFEMYSENFEDFYKEIFDNEMENEKCKGNRRRKPV